MKFVGEQLQRLALEQRENLKADVLGRSAFNRFYYASFLVTRGMLGKLNPSWKNTAHAAIPNHLRTAIRKPVKTQLDKNTNLGVINKSKKSLILSELKVATDNLADLLANAYSIRIIADYQPEIPITINNGKIICLEGFNLTTAQHWPDQANAYCGKILSVWRSCGFI